MPAAVFRFPRAVSILSLSFNAASRSAAWCPVPKENPLLRQLREHRWLHDDDHFTPVTPPREVLKNQWITGIDRAHTRQSTVHYRKGFEPVVLWCRRRIRDKVKWCRNVGTPPDDQAIREESGCVYDRAGLSIHCTRRHPTPSSGVADDFWCRFPRERNRQRRFCFSQWQYRNLRRD